MSTDRIRILDFDGSVTKQTDLVSRYKAEVVDMRDIGPAARFWMDGKTTAEVARRLSVLPPRAVTFTGSGDFHHISKLLLDRITEPVTLISFDTHPDWDMSSPWLCCGSWVREALKKPTIVKVLLLGASSCDTSPFAVLTGSLGALANDRVEIYPYHCRPTKVPVRAVPDNISIVVDRKPLVSTIHWNVLSRKNLIEFFLHIIRRLPTRKVYVTIDKDCLESEYALTNWGEGGFSLDELIMMLKELKDNLEIVGVDITGDYSPVRVRGAVKRAVSCLNRPRSIKATGYPEAFITKVNEQTNLKLLELLAKG